MRLNEANVAIVGLGLMGGSLALALRGKCRAIIGVVRRPETGEQALRMGAVHEATCDIAAGVSRADVVVLATPVRRIIEDIPIAAAAMRSGALLMDLGSTKREVARAMESVPAGITAVGGHPMCGKETGGLDSADADIFKGARFVLTPTTRTTDEAMSLATELAQAVGACPMVLDAEAHDQAVAAISHLPYLLAAALVHTEQQVSAHNPAAHALAASGFRDTSRLAASQTEMMRDILLTNREAVEGALDLFERNIALTRQALADAGRLEEWMVQAQARRREMFK